MALFQSLTNNVANTTITTNNGTGYFADGQIGAFKGTIAITANGGYNFTEPPTATHSAVYYENSKARYETKTVTAVLSDNNTVATFTIERLRDTTGKTQNALVTLNGTTSSTARTLQTVENLQNCTISGLPSTVTDATALNLTLTAANGYQFNAAPQLVFDQTILDENGNPTTAKNFTVSSDKLTATLSIDLAQCNLDYLQTCETLTINAAAAELPPVGRELRVVQNLQNCTISGLPSTVTNQSNLQLTLTAATDTRFNSTPTPTLNFGVWVLDDNGNPVTSRNFTVSTDGLTATLNINLGDCNLEYEEICTTLTINATTESTIKSVAITQNLTNCTTNAPQYINENTTIVNIIATANNGCEFATPPTILFYDANDNILHGYTFAVLSSKVSANVTFDVSGFDDFGDVETIVLTATAAAVVRTVELVKTLSNCTTNAPQYIAETDSVLTIACNANANCIFDYPPQLYILDSNGNPNVFNFTVSTDKLTATLNFDVADFGFTNIYTAELIATAETVTPYETKYGSINVYTLTENQLEEFSSKRFFVENLAAQSDAPQYENVDLGNFVHSLKRFYGNVGNVVADVLKCGNYNTHIAVNTPLNDVITIDCGTVTIPRYSENINDYNTTVIQLFAPFVGLVDLSSDLVGKTVKLEYVCNLITTETVINVIVNDIIITQIECELSNDIIYKTLTTQREFNTVGNVGFNSQILKGLQPYVIVKHFADLNKQVYNNENLRVTLGTIEGYARVTELHNFDTINVSREIYNRIVEVLNNGVIF